MIKLSVIIPFKNDFEIIQSVIDNLCEESNPEKFEIIIVNDSSVEGSGKFRPLLQESFDKTNLKVTNLPVSYGVGYGFDRGVVNCTSEIIVLMGADVFPKEGWYDKVVNAVQSNPNTLGCSVCIGDKTNKKYYGADLLFTVDADDLPEYSELRKRRGGYTSLFQAKWIYAQQSTEPYDIPCVLGAFYFTSKDYYNKIHGWDAEIGNRYCGHQNWGSLEPYISLKSWLVGGGCTLFPDIEATHIFSRIDKKHRFAKGLRSAEWHWWNRCFMAETMILDDKLRQKLYNFVHYELNFGVAQQMINQHKKEVDKVRERNKNIFIHDAIWFIDKFNVRIK